MSLVVAFYFEEGFTIIYWLAKMKVYVSNVDKLYKETRMVHLVNSGTSDLLWQIVQCWRVCALDREKGSQPMVLHCSGMKYKYYSCLVFLQ